MKKLTRLFRTANMGRMAVYLIALWRLFKHPLTPRSARWLAFAVVAYAVSPIDLIPDFIPVLGQLDDLILIPLGVVLVTRLTPADLWQSCLKEAERSKERLPQMLWGLVGVVFVWVAVMLLFLAWLVR